MALKIATRTGTAASWTSTNPVLTQGELATEYDTGKFKIGDGVTVWNSLAYDGKTGPAQTKNIRSLGDGSDGNVTISSGTTLLSRDMYYNNLTINGTGSLDAGNFKIFVKGILDLTAAPVGAIISNGDIGGDASGATGGSIATVAAAGSVGVKGQGGGGKTGTTAAGTTGTGGTAGNNGGSSNGGGTGGAGANAGGGQGGAIASAITTIRWYTKLFVRRQTLLNGGNGGSGGGSGGGDGTNNGGGSGAGGNSGGILALYVNILFKSASTPAGAIQANGGNGGAGSTVSAGNTGGGGGGNGGGGGWVYLAYRSLAGPVVMNLIMVNGGSGGTGGAGFGTGLGGNGGAGGNAGIITVINIMDETKDQSSLPTTNANYIPYVTAGYPAVGISGGNGGGYGYLYVSL